MDLDTLLTEQGYYAQKLRPNKVGHLYLNARVNGEKATFILDTGASMTVVDIESQKKLHLETEAHEATATGVGSTGMALEMSEGNEIKLRKMKIKDFPIVVINLEHVNISLVETGSKPVDGVLGADLLHRYKAIVDWEGRRIYWKPDAKPTNKKQKK